MTLYRVYYKENGKGYTNVCYIEVADSLGRKKVQEVRKIARELHNIDESWIVRIVKDC